MMLVPRNNFDIFDDFDNGFFKEPMMKTDIKEYKDHYDFKIDLPGFNKEDIKLNLEDGYLSIEAETNKENNDKTDGKYIRQERYYGKTSRKFYVGDISYDDIKANFRNGTLNIEIPKLDEINEKKYIEIED